MQILIPLSKPRGPNAVAAGATLRWYSVTIAPSIPAPACWSDRGGGGGAGQLHEVTALVRQEEGKHDSGGFEQAGRYTLVTIHHLNACASRAEVLFRETAWLRPRPARKHSLLGMEDPQIPAVTDLPHTGTHQPRSGLVGVPQMFAC